MYRNVRFFGEDFFINDSLVVVSRIQAESFGNPLLNKDKLKVKKISPT